MRGRWTGFGFRFRCVWTLGRRLTSSRSFSSVFLIMLMVSSLAFRPAAAQVPPAVDQPTQFPDATSSDTPARLGTPILLNVTAHDEPSRTLAFTVYWNYITDLTTGQGDPTDRDTLAVMAGSDGRATVSLDHTYRALGPLFQQDTDYDGVNDLGAYYIFVDVGNGVDNGTAAASSWVAANRMPSTTSGIGSDSGFYNVRPPNHTFTATLGFTVFDLDNDSLTVTWDFGDGTPLAVQVTPPARSLTDVRIQHVYDVYNPKLPTEPRPLSFLVTATVDDGYGHRILPRDGLNTTLNGYLWNDRGPQLLIGISFSPHIPGQGYAAYNDQWVNFSAEFTDPTGDALAYYWDFNNDSQIDASGSNVSWLFSAFGGPPEGRWYDVRLYVTDGDWKLPGDVHNTSLSVRVFVRDNLPPDAPDLPSDHGVFNATAGSPLTFYYQAYDPDGDGLTFNVDYGDGYSQRASTSPPPDNPQGAQRLFINHTYGTAGTYPLTVTLGDGAGHSVTRSAKVNVLGQMNLPPTILSLHSEVNGIPTDTFPVGIQVEFVANLSDPDDSPIHVRWDFGDYTSQAQIIAVPGLARASHIYGSGGSYLVTLTASDGFSQTSGQLGVMVNSNLPPSINYFHAEVNGSYTNRVPRGTSVDFVAYISDPDDSQVLVSLDFGDGSYASQDLALPGRVRISHTYTTPGYYTASITATDALYSSATQYLGIQVTVPSILRFSMGRPVEAQQSFFPPYLVAAVPINVTVVSAGTDMEQFSVNVYVDGRLDSTQNYSYYPWYPAPPRYASFYLSKPSNVSVDLVWRGQHFTAGPWRLPDYAIALEVDRTQLQLGEPAIVTMRVRADHHVILASRFDLTVTVDGTFSVESHFVSTSNATLLGSLCSGYCYFLYPAYFNLNTSNPTFWWSWRIPLTKGDHTISVEARDGVFGTAEASAKFTIKVKNQFAAKVKGLEVDLAASSQQLAALGAGFHPLGIDVRPLVERLRAIRTEAQATLAEVLPLGSVAMETASELTEIAMRADALATQAEALSAATASTAMTLWISMVALGLGGAAFIASRRRRRGRGDQG